MNTKLNNTNLNFIITSIINEERYSHCRLCLKKIGNQYVRFSDTVCLNSNSGLLQPLSDVLHRLLGRQFTDDIAGVDAVCGDCVNVALTSIRFIDECNSSSQKLEQLIMNLTNDLHSELNLDGSNKLLIKIDNPKTEFLIMKYPETKSTNILHYECCTCLKYFDIFDDYKAHNLTCHGKLTCEKCNKTFTDEISLRIHNHDHTYKCLHCPQYRKSEESLHEHVMQNHSLQVCKECGKAYRGLIKLHIHEEKHKKRSACPKCGKEYTTKDFYDRHVKLCVNNLLDPHPSRNSMKKSFSCEKCDKAYSTQGGLRVHNRFVHGNAKPHVCPECGKTFTAPSYLRVHMVKHTRERNFRCNICNNRFVTKEALLYHTRRHTGEKPYNCKLCSETFVNASARAEHMKFKHIGPTLMCEICSRKFVTSNFLKQHISRHHDPSSKLYYDRSSKSANIPLEQNIRKIIIKTEL